MYGYDHILVNGSLCAIAIACVEHVPAAARWAVPVFGLQQGGAAWLNAMALALGSIAPDMDVDRSLIRQLTCTDGLHYRGLHRGWSHSIWIIIAIGAAAAPLRRRSPCPSPVGSPWGMSCMWLRMRFPPPEWPGAIRSAPPHGISGRTV